MLFPIFAAALLGELASAYWVPPQPTPGAGLSNAERFQRGLVPRRPSRLFSPDTAFRARDAQPSGSPPVVSRGFLYAVQPGQTAQGCMISDGSWYIGGTCATYTQTLQGDSFTLSTSKGPCGVTSDSAFFCGSSQTATVFTEGSDGLVLYQSSDTFSTASVPPKNTRATVYTGNSLAVALNLQFTASSASPSSSVSVSASASSTSSTSAAAPTGTGLTICEKASSMYPLSCTDGAGADTCCYDSPGGHFLQTQFWDTGSTSTGPNNSWTLHGLWPDNCDGSYEEYCDVSRENSNIRGTLQSYGQSDLLSYMNTYWKDYQGDDEDFWEHEWDKHGTCMSSLEPRCFNNYTDDQEVVVYFQRAVALFQTLPTYDWLAADGIYPSLTKTYTLVQMESALTNAFGHEVNVNCRDGVFDEVWYHYESRGGIASGDIIPADPVGSGSTCPGTGIQYYPKYVDLDGESSSSASSSPTSTSSAPPTSTSAAPGSQPTNNERGFVYPTKSDGSRVSGTCLINAGVWYEGTCGGYRAEVQSDGSFKLKTNGGYCAIQSDVLTCASGVTQDTASTFAIDADGVVSYNGSSGFSAAQEPSGSVRVNVYADASQDIGLTLVYVAQ